MISEHLISKTFPGGASPQTALAIVCLTHTAVILLPPHFQMSFTTSDCSCLQVWITSFSILHLHEHSCYHSHVYNVAQLLKSSKEYISQLNAL